MKNYIRFDFDKLIHQKGVSKIYKSRFFRWLDKNKDCVFTIIDEYGDSSHMLHRHLEDHFIKHNIKQCYKKEDIIWIETLNPRTKGINKYIVVNKRLKG